MQLQREPSEAAAPPPPGYKSPDFSCFHVDIGVETEDNRYVCRPYTPLSTEAEYEQGSMLLIVKTYAQGMFTPLLAAKAVGTISPPHPPPPPLFLFP